MHRIWHIFALAVMLHADVFLLLPDFFIHIASDFVMQAAFPKMPSSSVGHTIGKYLIYPD